MNQASTPLLFLILIFSSLDIWWMNNSEKYAAALIISIYPIKPMVWKNQNMVQSFNTAYWANTANIVPVTANANAILFIKVKFGILMTNLFPTNYLLSVFWWFLFLLITNKGTNKMPLHLILQRYYEGWVWCRYLSTFEENIQNVNNYLKNDSLKIIIYLKLIELIKLTQSFTLSIFFSYFYHTFIL